MICKCLFYSLIWLSLVLSPFYDFLIQTELVKLHKKKNKQTTKKQTKDNKKKWEYGYLKTGAFGSHNLRVKESGIMCRTCELNRLK